MNEPDTSILAQLVRAKHACLVRLRDLAQRQFALIEAGNMTALLDLLSSKQKPLVDLQRIERALDAFRDQDPDQRVWPSPQERARCAAEVEECNRLLHEILAQDKRSEAALVRRRDEVAEQLESAHLAGRALGAYAGPPHWETSQVDLLSGK